MNKDMRKKLKLRVQAHPEISKFRLETVAALSKLPALHDKHTEKLETLTRRLLGMKMPKRVVLLHRGYFALRPCISGVVFTAAVFPSLGGRENHKLAAPMARLSDAIAYHFKGSRMRSGSPYNFDEAQAKADAEVLQNELESLSKILTACGVPLTVYSPQEVTQWDSSQCEHKESNIEARINSTVAHCFNVEAKAKEELEYLRRYVDALEKRITALENAKANENNTKVVDAIAAGAGLPISFL